MKQLAKNSSNVSYVVAGRAHTCAIRNLDGYLICIGETKLPINFKPINSVTSLVGKFEHLCATKRNDIMYCWGDSNLIKDQMENITGFETIKDMADTIQVNAGFNYNCGLKNDGLFKCWGENKSVNSDKKYVDIMQNDVVKYINETDDIRKPKYGFTMKVN